MIQPVGKFVVTTPGTLVSAMSQAADQSKPGICHGVMFQALPTNQGLVYIGTAAMVRATLANVYAILSIPTQDSNGNIISLPTFSAALTIAPNGLALSAFYLDADVANDGVLITILVT